MSADASDQITMGDNPISSWPEEDLRSLVSLLVGSIKLYTITVLSLVKIFPFSQIKALYLIYERILEPRLSHIYIAKSFLESRVTGHSVEK